MPKGERNGIKIPLSLSWGAQLHCTVCFPQHGAAAKSSIIERWAKAKQKWLIFIGTHLPVHWVITVIVEFESENNSLGEITLMWLKQASSLHVIFTVALNSLFSPQSEDPHCASAHTVRCWDAWGHYVNSTERRAVLTDTQQQPHGSSFTQVAMSYREKDGCRFTWR